MAETELSGAQRALYLRQIVLAEIGAEGQERLLRARFHAPHTQAGAIAERYLARAGLQPSADPADALEISWSPSSDVAQPIVSALHGSFLAVEAIKRALELGHEGQLDAHVLSPPRPRPQTHEAE